MGEDAIRQEAASLVACVEKHLLIPKAGPWRVGASVPENIAAHPEPTTNMNACLLIERERARHLRTARPCRGTDRELAIRQNAALLVAQVPELLFVGLALVPVVEVVLRTQVVEGRNVEFFEERCLECSPSGSVHLAQALQGLFLPRDLLLHVALPGLSSPFQCSAGILCHLDECL